MRPTLKLETHPVFIRLVDAVLPLTPTDRFPPRFVGERGRLTVYATDGHALARVIVKADFETGSRFVPLADMAARRAWLDTPTWLVHGLGTAPPVPKLHACTTEQKQPTRSAFDRQFDLATSKELRGFWTPAVLARALQVSDALTLGVKGVRISGNKSAYGPLLISCSDFEMDGLRADLQIVVMPRTRE